MSASITTNVLLSLQDVNTYYGKIHALRGISLKVNAGEIVTLLGSNGAGKSTALNTIVGLVPSAEGEIEIFGRRSNDRAPFELVHEGVALVPEGRHIFPNLSVRENLLMGAYTRKDPERIAEVEQRVNALFPVLAQRPNQLGSSLSGGEQQMLAIGRALMSEPKVLLLDEPSLGLAPLITREIFRTIAQLSDEQGLTILLVEQNAKQALRIASRAYVLEVGRIVRDGSSEELMADDSIQRAYLGGH
jgi:branched-chain amino acid transport system ATP-binding protein